MNGTLAHLVLKAVVVGRPHLQLDANLGKLFGVPVEQGLGTRRRVLIVKVQHQGLAGVDIAAVRVTGLDQQLLGLIDGTTHPLPIGPLTVNH